MSEAGDKKESKQGFWARLMAWLDKKMEEKAKAGSCCCSGSRERPQKDKC